MAPPFPCTRPLPFVSTHRRPFVLLIVVPCLLAGRGVPGLATWMRFLLIYGKGNIPFHNPSPHRPNGYFPTGQVYFAGIYSTYAGDSGRRPTVSGAQDHIGFFYRRVARRQGSGKSIYGAD